MYGTRRVRTGAELLGAGRSPLFQEGVTESRLRQRPRAVPSTAPGSAPPARGGKKSSRRRVVAARTVRGVPRGPLSGLRQLPDRRSGGAATGGPGGLGGGNNSASEIERREPRGVTGAGPRFGPPPRGLRGQLERSRARGWHRSKGASAPGRQGGEVDHDDGTSSEQSAGRRRFAVGRGGVAAQGGAVLHPNQEKETQE